MAADPELHELLQLARELVVEAASVALRYFRRDVPTRQKPDGTPVTDADLAVEALLLERLRSRSPDYGILSEEGGSLKAGSRRWVLDPIDGTAWFARGEDTWGTHIALEERGEVLLGVVSRPATGQCCWAARAGGAYLGGLDASAPVTRLSVSRTSTFPAGRLMPWLRPDSDRWRRLQGRATLVEPHMNAVLDLASGRIDAMVDEYSEPWDSAPGVVILEEAGGRFRDLTGGRDFHQRGSLCTNGAIDDALDVLLGGDAGTTA